jgi:protein SCO1/2
LVVIGVYGYQSGYTFTYMDGREVVMWLRNLFLWLLVALLAGCENPNCPRRSTPAIRRNVHRGGFPFNRPYGKTRTLADFRGKAVVLFSATLTARRVRHHAGRSGAGDAVVGKDADKAGAVHHRRSERDKPELLAQYAPAFHPSFLGLYGDAQATAQAAKAFYAGLREGPTASGYNMDTL